MNSSALVGRARELAAAERALDGTEPRGLVLAGPPGVGKTRLVTEILERACARGQTVVRATASKAAATIPFAAVAHLAPDVDTSDRLRLLRSAEQWLAAQPRPLVLGVDDAHDLDDASAALVHRVATTGTAAVVATLRAGSPAPDAVTALWTEGHAARLEVGPLDRHDTDHLLDILLGGSLDGLARQRLWHLSRGNALYLHELVRGGLASGALVADDGVWTWQGPVAPAPRLVTLVDERVGDLPSEVRDAVDLVALGEPLSASLLDRAGVASESVERAERVGVLRSDPAGRDIEVSLAHPLFGEVARARATPLRRRELARRLAHASKDSDDPVRRASWHLDGGVDDDPEVLVAGACRAMAALDLDLARRLARGAVDVGGGPPAARLLATALVLLGDGDEAETVLSTLGDGGPARDAAFRAWNLIFVVRDPERAEQVLAAAESASSDGHEHLTLQRALVDAYAGRNARALATASALADRVGVDDEVALRARMLVAGCLGVDGAYRDALTVARDAAALDRRVHGGDWTMAAEENTAAEACALLFSGRLDDADNLVTGARERAADAGWAAGLAVWLSWQADVLLLRGQARAALEHVREATALAARSSQPYQAWTERLRATQRARMAATVGEIAEAEAALREADALADGTTGIADVWVGSARGWVAAARGELTVAVDDALADAARARHDGQAGWEAVALHQVVRFGMPERAAERLAELARAVDGDLVPLYARQAVAGAAGDADELDAVADAFAALGCLLLAAEVGAQAGAAHRATGRATAAGTSSARARELATRCPGARTPALALLTDRGDLTRRENEIARLAASGLTNRAIADELVISVRTVDNTLHQVYAKLGVAGRRDLRVLLDLDGR